MHSPVAVLERVGCRDQGRLYETASHVAPHEHVQHWQSPYCGLLEGPVMLTYAILVE